MHNDPLESTVTILNDSTFLGSNGTSSYAVQVWLTSQNDADPTEVVHDVGLFPDFGSGGSDNPEINHWEWARFGTCVVAGREGYTPIQTDIYVVPQGTAVSYPPENAHAHVEWNAASHGQPTPAQSGFAVFMMFCLSNSNMQWFVAPHDLPSAPGGTLEITGGESIAFSPAG